MAHAEAETQETIYVNVPQKCDAFQKPNHSKTNLIKQGNNRQENEYTEVANKNIYVDVQPQQATVKGKLFKYL